MNLLSRSSDKALLRLNKLISPRGHEITPQPQQLLLIPPSTAIRPILKLSIIAILAAATLWWLTKPANITQVETGAIAKADSEPANAAAFGQLVVHVAGDVVNPGIVTLSAGSRVIDAIEAAGGLLPEVTNTGLNLAAHLNDGQLIQVGQLAVIENDNRINLNTATLAELDTLPGVGPVTAQRILDWRLIHNQFSSIEELQEISGIGPKLFGQIKNSVRI